MDKALITCHQAIEGLRQAVTERGRDHIDPQAASDDCYYVLNDRPSCIGGTVLFKLGVPMSELKRWEGNNVLAMVPGGKTYLTGYGDASLTDADGLLTEEAGAVLYAAQDVQDSGDAWGDGLDAAEAKYREITEGEQA